MFFSDIFTPGILICLGLIIAGIAGLIVYFENKFREQNHKMVSMLSVVSSLAEDVDSIRKQNISPPIFRDIPQVKGSMMFHESNSLGNDLICVSDNEESDESETNSDSEYEAGVSESVSEDSDEDLSDEEDSDEEVSDEDEEEKEEDDLKSLQSMAIHGDEYEPKIGVALEDTCVKIVKLNLNLFSPPTDTTECPLDEELNVEEEVEEELQPLNKEYVEEILNLQYSESESKVLEDKVLEDKVLEDKVLEDKVLEDKVWEDKVLEDKVLEDKVWEESKDNVATDLLHDLKNITIDAPALGENAETMDLKKVQLSKLRGIVIEKGLASAADAHKLKKQELLKLLEK
jgi:hypothetical protein